MWRIEPIPLALDVLLLPSACGLGSVVMVVGSVVLVTGYVALVTGGVLGLLGRVTFTLCLSGSVAMVTGGVQVTLTWRLSYPWLHGNLPDNPRGVTTVAAIITSE